MYPSAAPQISYQWLAGSGIMVSSATYCTYRSWFVQYNVGVLIHVRLAVRALGSFLVGFWLGLAVRAFGGASPSVSVLGLGRRLGLPGPLQSREATPSRRTLIASDSAETSEWRRRLVPGSGGSSPSRPSLHRLLLPRAPRRTLATTSSSQATNLASISPLFACFARENPRLDSYAARFISCLLC